ncbi:MAG: BMC domain-containing protein [Candidatus Latescibacterota bacterium]|nr:BMC domain-containing protein [Candidatus Latescibacterota bacterium]
MADAGMSALGIFECRGVTSLVAALDSMGKAADIRLQGRHGIGSGWLTIVIEGTTAAVQSAMHAGRQAAERQGGELITMTILPRPEAAVIATMPHAQNTLTTVDIDSTSGEALGWLETMGVAPLAIAVDRMVKAADVELLGWTFIGGALVHAVIRGSVGDVETAIAAGAESAATFGEPVGQLVLEQPEPDVFHLLPPAKAGTERRVGALGLVETTGYVGAVHGADRMVKEAAVEIVRLTIGSGGRVATIASGALDDVKAAVSSASEDMAQVAENNGEALITNPDPQVVAAFADPPPATTHPTGEALGLLETRTTVGLISAVDAMLKSSKVSYEGRYKVGYFLTAAVIRGELGAVNNALDVGGRAAQRHGELVARHVIALPYSQVTDRLSHA